MSTTATASIKSVAQFDADTPESLVVEWADSQWKKGYAAQRAGTKPRWSTKSEPFAEGYTYAEAQLVNDTEAMELRSVVNSVAKAVAEHAERVAQVNAEAASIEAAAQAVAMNPDLAHYESEALLEAMGVVGRFGGFDPQTSEFKPVIVRDLAVDADRARHTAKGIMPHAWGMQKRVLKRINDTVDARLTQSVLLQFAANYEEKVVDGRPRRFPVDEPGMARIIFLTHTEDAVAFRERGEVGWALFYTPPTYEWVDRDTGEIVTRNSWTSDAVTHHVEKATARRYCLPVHWHGVCRVYHDYDTMTEEIEELRRALRTIRDADALLIREQLVDETVDPDRTPGRDPDAPLASRPIDAAF